MTLDTTVHPVTVTAGQSGNNVVDAGIATVTNNYPVTSVTVDKTWLNGSTNINSTIQNAYVTVELRADGNAVTVDASGAAIAPVTLDGYTDTVETVAWTYTWTNLPKYDSTGAEISYTVVETSAKVETNVGTGTDLAPTDATGSMATGFKLTNTLPKTNIKAKKNWPENQTVPANTTVELTLKGTVPGEGENAEPVAHTITGVTTVVTLNGTEDPAWEYEWANLPKYDTAGKEITYTVTETAYTIGGVAQTVATADSSATEGYQFSFTNTLPSTNIKIVKVEQGTETTLSGAKFQLKTSDGTDVGEEITIPASGEYTFIGLADGQYKIVETQAPAGYNMMSQEISFTITGGTVITENSSSISTVTYTQAVDDDPVTPDVNEASPATFTVGNTPGVELPATGGPGTAFYTASGLVLLLGASLWLILRRRKEQQN